MKRRKPSNVIDLTQGPKDDGRMDMSFINGKWRCAQFARRVAEDDNKRVEIEQAGKERL